MFGTVIAIALVVLLIIYLIGRARKKQPPLVELRADEKLMHRLGLRPGEMVELRNSEQVKEVHVFAGPNGGSRLGTLTQKFIYDGVIHNAIKARIHSIKGSTVQLELGNVK